MILPNYPTTRKRGFTLVETLVAMAVLVVVLSAASVAGRALLASAQKASDRAQLVSLAEESINTVRLYRDSLPIGSPTTSRTLTLDEALGVGRTGSAYGMFYAQSIGDNFPSAGNLEPLIIKWCIKDTGQAFYQDMKCNAPALANRANPVGMSRGNGTVYCGDNTVSPVQPCTLGAMMASLNGDIVAVRRTSHALTADEPCPIVGGGNPNVIDATNPTNRTCIFSNNTQNWDYYSRVINVDRLACPNDMSSVCTGTYFNEGVTVSVTVTNLNNLSSTYTETATVFDYDPGKLPQPQL